MSATQLHASDTQLHQNKCPHCGAILPDDASFCNNCGERLDSIKHLTTLLEQEEDIATRYRITSLVRRRPFVSLYFAVDLMHTTAPGQSRMVAIRDIDCSSLNDKALVEAVKLAQQEYDLLRRNTIPRLMAAIDLRYARGHLYLIANQPAPPPSPTGAIVDQDSRNEQSPRLITLQDYLQSGQGLPSEQTALQWMAQLCEAADSLRQLSIVIGDLDPSAILYNGATGDTGAARLSLTIAWLPQQLRKLLLVSSASTRTSPSYFIAPEVSQGYLDARSDVYSLGAILYLLLTGMPPGEAALREHGRPTLLRPPHEINGQISPQVSDCVMQALALQLMERFESAAAFAFALRDPHYHRPEPVVELDVSGEAGSDVETVRIFPLSWKDIERWRTAHRQAAQPSAQQIDQASLSEAPTIITPPVVLPIIPKRPATPRPPALPAEAEEVEQDLKEPVTVSPPAFSTALGQFRRARQLDGQTDLTGWMQRLMQAVRDQKKWFEYLKRVVLGRQQQAITVAAIVETPLRVLPDQVYTLRIYVVGRNDPGQGTRQSDENGELGLSKLVCGDSVLIEVRSVLQQSFAYLVQRASLTIPQEGYAAEVTIPLRSLSNAPSGRHDRLHISFMDEHHHLLYEKPFAVEVFVSNRVKPGNEGHNVLTIPL